MTRNPSRKLAAAAALLTLSLVAVVPSASAASAEVEPNIICGVLPLWDQAFCWLGVALNAFGTVYDIVTCDVIGGPACGFNVCNETGICTQDEA